MIRALPFLLTVLSLASVISFAETIPGTLPGEVKVLSSGQAQYDIPVNVPPGTAGMEPDLSFIYHTGAGNGPMGMGWSIGGLSVIQRTGQNLFFDNNAQGIRFNGEDRFQLDGQRLIGVDGDDTYWNPAGGNEYRTAVESFTCVRAIGSNPEDTGPEKFIAQTKSGLTFVFGDTSVSEDSVVKVGGQVHAWYVSRIIDTFGNYIEFHYSDDAAGSNFVVVTEVRYTGRMSGDNGDGSIVRNPYARIKFHYKTPRNDTFVSYLKGTAMRLEKLLTSAEVQEYRSGAWQTSWEYDLVYSDNSGLRSKASHLKSISYSSGTDDIPSTVFDWKNPGQVTPEFHDFDGIAGVASSYKVKWPGGSVESYEAARIGDTGDESDFEKKEYLAINRRFLRVDLEGDGSKELVKFFISNNKVYAKAYDIGRETDETGYALSEKNGDNWHYLFPIWSHSEVRLNIGDFDGDGIEEIYAVHCHWNGHLHVRVVGWNGQQLTTLSQGSKTLDRFKNNDSDNFGVGAGDFNGDGKDEVVWGYCHEGYNTYRVYYINDPKQAPAQLMTQGPDEFIFEEQDFVPNSTSMEIQDVDGNGLLDAVVRADNKEFYFARNMACSDQEIPQFEHKLRVLGFFGKSSGRRPRSTRACATDS